MPNIQTTNNAINISNIGASMAACTSFKPYDVRISRDRPACFLFLIDQSGSMRGHWGADAAKTKAEIVADYINNGINELINICQKSDPQPLHYFDICVVGYGQNDEKANVIWQGNLANRTFVSPADLKNNPTGNQGEIEIERRTFKGVSMVKIPVTYWFEPVANSLTPMGSAIDLATELLIEWTASHPNSFPPIVINITDGQQTDCEDDELLEKAYALKQCKTLYGQSLFFNIHISENEDEPVLFPTSAAELPGGAQCQTLYDMSSALPEIFNKRIATEIKKQDYLTGTEYVAVAYQASLSSFIRFLDIGTKTVKA